MRPFLSGYLYKVALGAGMLALIGLISADLWLWQRDDRPAPALGASEAAPRQLQTGVEVPGLPARNTTGDRGNGGAGPASSAASASDSAELEVQRGGPGPGLTAADGATVSDSARLDDTGTGPGFTASDDATVSDSAELEVQQAQSPPPRGGPGDTASLGDSAGLVVRDAEGNIKHQETVK
ncbi:MAG: hypothetical protein O7F09_05810 [Chloroflexi bacterium]|nr:hypothetical protein [Chloroflexota bacterium]